MIIPGNTGYQSIFGGAELVGDMEIFPGGKVCWMTTQYIIDYIKSKEIDPIMHTIAMMAHTASCYAHFLPS